MTVALSVQLTKYSPEEETGS